MSVFGLAPHFKLGLLVRIRRGMAKRKPSRGIHSMATGGGSLGLLQSSCARFTDAHLLSSHWIGMDNFNGWMAIDGCHLSQESTKPGDHQSSRFPFAGARWCGSRYEREIEGNARDHRTFHCMLEQTQREACIEVDDEEVQLGSAQGM